MGRTELATLAGALVASVLYHVACSSSPAPADVDAGAELVDAGEDLVDAGDVDALPPLSCEPTTPIDDGRWHALCGDFDRAAQAQRIANELADGLGRCVDVRCQPTMTDPAADASACPAACDDRTMVTGSGPGCQLPPDGPVPQAPYWWAPWCCSPSMDCEGAPRPSVLAREIAEAFGSACVRVHCRTFLDVDDVPGTWHGEACSGSCD